MIDGVLADVVAAGPERVAIAFGDRRISYAELAADIAGLRAGLRGLGIGLGDCVLLVLPNCPQFVVGYFATAGLGATVQALDPRLAEAELVAHIAECKPAVVLTTQGSVERLRRLAASLELTPEVVAVDGPEFARLIRGDDDGPEQHDGPWVYTYTSGSSGEPKRICRSKANQLAEARNIITSAGITPSDAILCAVPLFHALGQLCCMIVSMCAGATLVLAESDRVDVGDILGLARAHRVTVFPAVPYLLGALADWPTDRDADLSSIRLCLSGSNFLSADIRQRFLARFGVPVRQTYGSSEAGSVSWDCDPETFVEESVGRPLSGVRVDILDDHGNPAPAGAVGEIAVGGDSVMVGYAERGGLRGSGGRHLTGDLGRLGPDGRLYLLGRKRFLIDSGGHKVNPVEVEEVLAGHPDLVDAAVVGLPLSEGGELVVAAVVSPSAVNVDLLRAYCRERLADYKVPARFTVVDAVPRTALGKVRRAELTALVAAEQTDSPADRTVAEQLARMAAVILGVAPEAVAPTTPLRELGLDSLGALRLKMAVQDGLRRTVGLSDLLGRATVESLAQELAGQEETSPVAHSRQVGEFPLSHNQLSIWHADQVAPDSATYNENFAARLISDFDVDALRRTFQALVDRHPVLRTTFGVRDGVPFQRVAAWSTVDFQVAAGDPNEEAYRPFDLCAAPPLRVRLYPDTDGGPVLLVSVHHIITDFWSLVTMLREIGVTYAMEHAGGDVYRPAPPYSYTDYARWLDDMVAGPEGERDWNYWRDLLGSPPPALELPTDKPRPVVPARRGATYFHDFGRDCVDAVRAFARDNGTTVYSVLLAAFTAFLHGYTGERDVALATITTSRQRAEFRDVLGYFVNPVVSRTRVEPATSFEALLDSVQRGLLAGLEHQLLPFELIVDRLGIKRHRSRAPLVEYAFGQSKSHEADLLVLTRFLSGRPGEPLQLGLLALEPVALRQRGVVYDLSGAVYESGDEISVAWEYSTELFEDGTVRRMAAGYERLLMALLDRPQCPVGQIELVGGDERAWLLDASRGADRGPRPETVPAMIAELAGQRPDAAAVRSGAAGLSRAELVERAARLAGAIRSSGAEPGSTAVLWLADPIDLAVAGLGVLTAGLVGDAVDDLDGEPAGALLITTADRLGRSTSVPTICVDRATAAPAFSPEPDPDGPALVLRSSGVTGPPRAARLAHTALADWAEWQRDHYGPLGDVLVQNGLRADRVLARLLTAVAAGGTAVCGPLTAGRSYDLVTVTATELADLLRTPTGVRASTLVVAGETVPGRLVADWRALTGNGRVVHEYGGVDTAPVVSAYEVPEHLDGPIPVGKPLPGMQCRVLDDSGRLCPVGVVGELHVGATPTGDLGRYLPSGDLVVLGRAEHVTTVRGYRVLFGQLEQALLGRPGVTGAVVSADDGRGLVAHVATEDPAGLREWLRERLPEHLVPTEIVVLDRLPRAGNGKTARTGLAGPAVGEAADADAEPLTPTEAALAAIWAKVLGLDVVRPTDDYFDLDGDSITTMRIVAKAAELGIRIVPRQLFTAPTVRELAAVAELVDAEPVVNPVAEPDRGGPVALSPIQGWFFEHDFAEPSHWNQAILLRARQPLDSGHLRAALHAVADHHAAFRLRYSRTSDGWSQHADPAAQAVLVTEHDGPVSDVAAATQASLDIERGPVFAAVIVRDGAELSVLLVAHHLVVDFVSWQIVIDDLALACDQLRSGDQVRLPATTTSFARWTELTTELADSPGLAAELDHWASLAGDEPRPVADTPHRQSTVVTTTLCAADTEQVLSSGGEETVLAAVAHAVAGWTGERRVRVDVEGHGREDLFDGVDLSRTVGWFTAAHPVLFEFPPQASPAQARQVAREALRRVPGKGIGYGLLRHSCGDPAVHRRLAEVPRATVNFTYLGRMGRLLDGADSAADGRGLFEALPLPDHLDRAPDGARPYPLEISAMVTGDRLSVRVVHGEPERTDVGDLLARVVHELTNGRQPMPPTQTADVATLVRTAWSGALRHRSFGDDDDFFAIGGHSLMVARIMAELGRAVGRRLPLRMFFDHPTVSRLSDAIADGR
ncbi:condensation domain-containing protein [Kutzneria sp. NPDC052558]|uniref:condensation domain-containing protein n=1 Tax=Kutzneria sp. NPDC052558 TaxID=3364121 RepID=UPI0037CB9C92